MKFDVLHSEMIVPNIHVLELEAPAVAREIQPGQFVILRVEEDGERIPLSIADWDRERGSITLCMMNVGRTTDKLAGLRAGDSIPTVVGPLGIPTEIDDYGTALCLGGCYGIGSIYPIARALKERGNRVITVLEARSSFLCYWEDRLGAVSDVLIHITRDGTKGTKGHVGQLAQILRTMEEPVHRMIVNGCTFLLKIGSDTSRPLRIPTVVSLNPIMIDGTGMCGICRVSVGGKTQFACVDGPDFDGHAVDWEELLMRRRSYMREESIPLRTSSCEGQGACMSG